MRILIEKPIEIDDPALIRNRAAAARDDTVVALRRLADQLVAMGPVQAAEALMWFQPELAALTQRAQVVLGEIPPERETDV